MRIRCAEGRVSVTSVEGSHFTLTGLEPGKYRLYAFAGIAKPPHFFSELERAGWKLMGRRSFRDHHQYSAAEIGALAREARDAGAEALVTTSKDIVRLSSTHRAAAEGMPVIEVPLHISIERGFRLWMRDRLSKVRSA